MNGIKWKWEEQINVVELNEIQDKILEILIKDNKKRNTTKKSIIIKENEMQDWKLEIVNIRELMNREEELTEKFSKVMMVQIMLVIETK